MVPLMLMSGTMGWLQISGRPAVICSPISTFPIPQILSVNTCFDGRASLIGYLGLWFQLEFQIRTSCTEIILVH
jgi:hypothetical protein